MRNGLRSTDITSTMGHILRLVVDTIVTSVLERPEQRHGRAPLAPSADAVAERKKPCRSHDSVMST
jgi:hypothetical protein